MTVVILRCRSCGDTFPVDDAEGLPKCPSCDSDLLEVASEPLL